MADSAILESKTSYLEDLARERNVTHFPGSIIRGLQVIHVGRGIARCKLIVTDRVLFETMKTTIADLPRDLMTEILARVPMKSTRAVVRLTCKKWNTLSKNQMSVAKKHIDKVARGESESESTMIGLIDKSLYLMTIDVDNLSVEVKGKLSCLDEEVKISKVLNCKGLLLCVLEDETRLVVWNPNSGQTTWIEPRNSTFWRGYDYALGYEDNKSCHTFKLLRFTTYPRFENEAEKPFLWYEIYNFDTGLWTTLDITPHWLIFSFDIGGVSLKGNTYWCVSGMKGLVNRLICFDFTRERFGPFLPLPFTVKDWGSVQLSCVREEKLSVLSHAYRDYDDLHPCKLEIWVTTKIEAEKVSWSKVFKYKTKHHPINVEYIGSFYLIDEEKKVAMGYDRINRGKFISFGDAGFIRGLDLEVPVLNNYEHDFRWPCMFSYVPSLVEIKEPTLGKRERGNSLEKRRFAQKMLGLFEDEDLRGSNKKETR